LGQVRSSQVKVGQVRPRQVSQVRSVRSAQLSQWSRYAYEGERTGHSLEEAWELGLVHPLFPFSLDPLASSSVGLVFLVFLVSESSAGQRHFSVRRLGFVDCWRGCGCGSGVGDGAVMVGDGDGRWDPIRYTIRYTILQKP
jgi:hypothetical protein